MVMVMVAATVVAAAVGLVVAVAVGPHVATLTIRGQLEMPLVEFDGTIHIVHPLVHKAKVVVGCHFPPLKGRIG